jgi:hypothetical protein
MTGSLGNTHRQIPEMLLIGTPAAERGDEPLEDLEADFESA